MNDSGGESIGVLASGSSLADSFVDVESNKENCDGGDDAVGGFVVRLLWLCTC